MAVFAAALAGYIALSARGVGDYSTDGGPALNALVHHGLGAFAHATAAMGSLSLLVRAPFAILLGRAGQLEVYRWGALPCALAVAVLAVALARIARRRGTGAVGQWAIVLVALINPLVSSAISSGHPEELLTASLVVGALVAALERHAALATLLLGLALACKQWAVVAVLPVLFALERERVRALLGALAVALVVTLPEIVGAPLSYLHNQFALAHSGFRTTHITSWWRPLATPTVLDVRVGAGHIPVTVYRIPAAAFGIVRPLIISVGLLVAAAVALARRLPLRRDDALALLALVLLLRSTLDTETEPYYHCGFLLALLAWDAMSGERLPVRALLGAAVAWVVFERLTPPHVSSGTAGLAYSGCTVAAAVLLARSLAARSRRSAHTRSAGAPARAVPG
jgi:hypothetical protein